MPRLRLRPQEIYPFRKSLAVRTTDLNYGGHLGHETLLSLVQEARVAWLAANQWHEMDCGGVGLIMGDVAVVYQGEAVAGDVLDIEVATGECSKSGFRMFYRVTKSSGAQALRSAVQATPVALVETGMVCFDYTSRRISTLPAAVAAVIRGSQA